MDVHYVSLCFSNTSNSITNIDKRDSRLNPINAMLNSYIDNRWSASLIIMTVGKCTLALLTLQLCLSPYIYHYLVIGGDSRLPPKRRGWELCVHTISTSVDNIWATTCCHSDMPS